MNAHTPLKVSIIVPIYNTEQFLKRSISSLIQQSYKNIEILLIDDGSSDHSLAICYELAQIDSRIQVLHQENQGVSAARNNATKRASGQYIMYFDSDDVLVSYAIQRAVEYAQKYNADFVIGGIVEVPSPEAFEKYEQEQIAAFEIYTQSDYDALRRHYFGSGDKKFSTINHKGSIGRGPAARLLRREIALNTPFPQDVPIGEDVIWNMRLLKACKKTVVVFDIWYGYVIHPSSAIRKYHGDRAENVSKYLLQLEVENQDFFQRNTDALVVNTAIELYCIANYELLSPKCPLTDREKRRLLKKVIQQQPWNVLYQPGNWKYLSWRHRAMLPLYRTGTWPAFLKLWNMCKSYLN